MTRLSTESFLRLWPGIIATVKTKRRTTWSLLDPRNARVVELGDDVLKIGFEDASLVDVFKSGAHATVLERAVREMLGYEVQVEAVHYPHGGYQGPEGGAKVPSRPKGPRPGSTMEPDDEEDLAPQSVDLTSGREHALSAAGNAPIG